VGGDFFTVSPLSETQAGVFLCDVAGHGVRSALVTAMIRALVEELKAVAMSPGDFLTKLNNDLCAILKHTGTPLLTTAFYLVADCATRVLRYSNAGHPKPLHLRRDASQIVPLLNASGKSQPALGLTEGSVYHTSEVLLRPHDAVFLYTDGLIEAHNLQGDLYTSALLTSAVQQRLNLPAGELFDALLAEVRHFANEQPFTDDVCLVGMEVSG
jgi:serine phosphatase RsbU (regulator of sigma subunit)